MPAERILVTGAAGFIGRHVSAALAAAGYEVGAIGRTPASRAPGIAWFAADLLSPEGTAAVLTAFRPGVLVHAAWVTRHGYFWGASENPAWVEATVRLARAFRDAGGRRFVGLGSCAEYDWTLPGDAPWPESRPISPATDYGRAKAAAASHVAALCEDAGMTFAWARLFHLFGESEHPDRLVPSVALALLRGEPAEVGSGRPVRDFCDSAHAGRAIAALALSEVTGPVNIGTGEPLAIADLVRLLALLCGRPELLRLGARPDRPDDPPFLAPDVSRLREDVEFRERHDLRAHLTEAVARLRLGF